MDVTEPLGFRRERRPFSAHITLGRVKRSGKGGGRKRGRGRFSKASSSFPTALQEQLEKMMNYDEKEAAHETKNRCSFHVNHVALMESKFSKNGPQYIALERFDLLKSN